jgi:hypothetical protein
MTQPTGKQLRYLASLGYEGGAPTSSLDASIAIDACVARSAQRALRAARQEPAPREPQHVALHIPKPTAPGFRGSLMSRPIERGE